jgi:hypothetical protein
VEAVRFKDELERELKVTPGIRWGRLGRAGYITACQAPCFYPRARRLGPLQRPAGW